MRHLLPEVGHVRVTTEAGREYTFRPALSRVAALGDPVQIVATYGDLHRQSTAISAAAYVLATMCDDDCTDLIGYADGEVWRFGAMPPGEMLTIARHLMQHGIAGKARPGAQAAPSGKYSPRFDVAEHVAAAVAHLGVSRDDALGMTMTEMQLLVEAKFPDAKAKARDVPTRDEYRAQMAAIMERRNKATGNAQ